MKEIVVAKNDAGQRLDRFLSKAFPDLARSMMYKGLRSKKIKVNRKRASYDQKLQEGDVILLFLPEDALFQRTREIKGNPDVDVIFENDDLLIVNKPAGLLSQKDTAADQDTLNDRIQAYLYQKGDYNPLEEQSFVPAVCHRLDRNTSGLVAAAKSAAGARAMSAAIAAHALNKSYLAVAQGHIPEGRHEVWIKKEGTRAVVASQNQQDLEGYQQGILTVCAQQEKGDLSLAEIELETGRFHQIRATLASLGHPLAGDVKYGGRKNKNGYQLQAFSLGLDQVDLPNLPKKVELPADRRIHL